jgi:NADPH:quinone reductase-like Zn-dependent oxidoreductase
LRSAQKIRINGAGGAGTIAVQLAKCQDVEVTGVHCAVKFEMMRAIGFDHVIDYRKDDFTASGRRYELILDTKTTRSPFGYTRSLSPGRTYAAVGGTCPDCSSSWSSGGAFAKTTRKTVRLIMLKQNRDLPY